MTTFHRTAITRKAVSVPMRKLVRRNVLLGRILDYGCGRGFDVEYLHGAGFDITGYDPNGAYYDETALNKVYRTITCHYVLNVVADPLERLKIEKHIIKLLKRGGIAYITVRNDAGVADGYTSIGTWQGYVEPQKLGWTMIDNNSKSKTWYYLK